MSNPPALNQIAFSVIDLRLTETWFRVGFGFLPSGGSRQMMRGPLAAAVQGLPGAASTCWWLVGRNPWFQLELFQFERPLAKLMPPDFRPCDIAYTRIGIWVSDFDATLTRLAELDSIPLTPPLGGPGQRRACVRNPDGVYVEIMEDDPLAGLVPNEREDCPAAVRSVTLSVPDLAQTALFLQNGIGITATKIALHQPEHEALWGLPGAQTRSRCYLAGDVLIEAVQYLDPVGKPRPDDYRICDQGILNIAFGARNKHEHMQIYRRCLTAGAKPNCRPVHLPPVGAGVVYVNDSQGFSFEILWMKRGWGDRLWGFEPLPLAQRPDPDTQYISHKVRLAATPEQVWSVLADHEGMARWSGFTPVNLSRPGFVERNGYGAERSMQGPPGIGMVGEQVTGWLAQQRMRYRVIHGSPFSCHQGELALRAVDGQTELSWSIRFRPKLPGTGGLLRRILFSKLVRIMETDLRLQIENP